MRRWTLVPLATMLLAACARGGAVCEQLRVPSASIEYAMVHLASFDEVYNQAVNFASAFNLPSFKTAELTRQLLGAMEDMVRYQTSEAMVNITLDHTLRYSVSFEDPFDTDAVVERDILFTPEQPVQDTVKAFCEENRLGEGYHERLQPQLVQLLVRDWGCETDQRTNAKPEPVAHSESPTSPASERGVSSTSARPAALKIRRKRALPVLAVGVDGESRQVEMSSGQTIELQATVLCQQWKISLEDCLVVRDAMRNITHDHPAFAKPVRNRTSATTELQLHLSSPKTDVLHRRSEKLYLDGEWWNMTTGDAVTGRYNVCVHVDLALEPLACTLFPPAEIWYIRPNVISHGHHVFLFSKGVDPPQENHEDNGDDDEDEDDGQEDDGQVKEEAPRPVQYIAAQHFWVVSPTVEIKDIQLEDVDSRVFLNLQIQTTAVDLNDPEVRVCVLVDAELECFKTERIHIEAKTGIRDQITTLFRVPVFDVSSGQHTISVMLFNSVKNSFASTVPMKIGFTLTPEKRLAEDSTFLTEPPLATHHKLPVQCPQALLTAGLAWICDLWRHEWGRYSQNGEDGVLQSIFHNVGVTNRYYVEFGTETGAECNTRYLRLNQNWTGLLMDGGHENAAINLHQEWISPENINELFTKYDVPSEFDMLSIDVDFNDYWILEAIDRTRFSPRVLVIEINSHIPPDEARVVKYSGPETSWDAYSLFFGVSVGAMHLWGQRNGYSLVYCESRGVNCFLIRDDVLASVATEDDDNVSLVVSDVLRARDLHTPPNFFSKGLKYPPPKPESGVVEEWVWLDEQDE